MFEHAILQQLVFVITLGIAAQWLAWRLKMPAIVLLVVFGALAGPGFGWVNPEQDFGNLITVFIKLAVAVILFEGGLNLRFHELKETRSVVRSLVLVSLPIAWLLGAGSAHYIAGVSLPVSLVLGAILVVTGPTVIMPMIRQANLSQKMASLFKWEGIVNDPLGALLAVLVFEFFVASGELSPSMNALVGLTSAFLLSAALGVGCAYFIRISFHSGWVPEYLKVPLVLCFIFLVYGGANIVQEEAGLLAVTVFGFVLGNVRLRIIDDLRQFKEYITVFLVSTVFITLTATLKVEHLTGLNLGQAFFLASILFIVRPVSIWIATIGSGLHWKQRVLLGWIGPRGVVAASMAGLFAPKMIELGYADAQLLVPLVFWVIFLTVCLHGFSLNPFASALGLSTKKQEGLVLVGANPWTTDLAKLLFQLKVPVILCDQSWHRLREARINGIPYHYGEVLSETSEESLDLSGMGHLLAATDNDAYNALVCSAFAPHFGRENVFQLALLTQGEDESPALRSTQRGRIAFAHELSYEKLMAQHYLGWKFQKTTLTKEFQFKDFLEKVEGKAEPILFVTETGKLVIDTQNREVKPSSGDILVSFAEKPEDSDKETKRKTKKNKMPENQSEPSRKMTKQ